MYELLNNWISPWIDHSYGFYFFFLILCIVFGFYLLIKGGDWLSDHSAKIAYQLGVPPVVVGLTIVSIATSTPELFTSISALRSDSPGLILGNIIGSNIANIALILGIALLIGSIPTQDAVSRPQRICLISVSLFFCLVLSFSSNQEIGLISGAVLLVFLVLYLSILTISAIRNKHASRSSEQISHEDEYSGPISISMLMLLVSTLALWAGADSLVYGSKSLAQIGGIPEELIGFTLLAIGTSLPELAASISLVRKGQTSMLLGNIVGSNLFNISLIGGLAGIWGPVSAGSPNPWVDYLFLMISTLLLVFWLRGKNLAKREGIILLLIYAGASISTWILNS
jgi:cation:H+ antiporter